MAGASSYLAILAIAAFLFATWSATKISKAAGISSIVLEILTGVILGPNGPAGTSLINLEYTKCEHRRHTICDIPADFAERLEDNNLGKHLGAIANKVDDKGEPVYCKKADYDGRRLAGGGDYASYEECLQKSCEADISARCGLTPDVFTMIGHAGVAMMIFESGMHFDFDKAMIVGPKACVVAVIGTLLPLFSGAGLMMGFGYKFFPDAISVGTALAPTSIGIALRLLGEAGVLQDDFGQAIITADFVDDILSLILFNVLFSLGASDSFDVVKVVVYPTIGVVFMCICMVAAVKFWPWMINEQILARIPAHPAEKTGMKKVARKDEVLFLLMILMLIVYGTVTHFLGTHLWGCFIAGMSFACLKPADHTHHVWVKQTSRITSWMIRIFFSCTVAFSIPVKNLLSLEAFWKGSIVGIGPCVLAKVLCAPFMGRAKFVIGWAMVGRAEFAYLIAQMAYAANMIDDDAFSISIWALLYATIFAPLAFRKVLNEYVKEMNLTAAVEDAKGKPAAVEDAPVAAAEEKIEVEVGVSALTEENVKGISGPAVEIDDELRSNLDEEGVKVSAVEGEGVVDM